MGDGYREEVAGQIAAFVASELAPGAADGAIGPGDDLFDSGVLDSAGMAQLIGFVQGTFGVEVGDDDLVAENFETVAAIARLVESKTAIASDDRAV